ncbi:MAG: copper amine oxidase N-terminal domain-containing protein, partial [Peptococcaceae bacterium]|nr:copper amine oxidase N-terminal domain-containing protein [Peptococcaceae bacterium]
KVNISPATENADYDSKIVLQIGNRSTAVNGEEFSNDVAPVIIGDRTMVPIRVIIESLGGAADWDEATRTVTLTIGGQVLRMVIDEIIGGFDAAPMIMNGRTYVPVRYIAEAVGAQVEWIEASQQIVIKN